MYEFGARLKAARKRRGLNQRELGERIGKSKSAVASYEQDVQHPPFEVAVDIARVLNVSLNYLAEFDNESVLVTTSLSAEQKQLLKDIVDELLNPSTSNETFSAQQLDIINRLLTIFKGNR